MSNVLKRLFGLVILLVGLSGVVLAVAGWQMLPEMVQRIHANVEATLLQTSAGLDTVEASLLLAKDTVADLDTALTTVETNMTDLGQAVSETRPFLDQVSTVASDELPETLEALETSIPDMANVAGIVDDTLTTLNRFRIDETFLGFRINYSLGVDYDPDVPFDETVLTLGESLDGLPESLRGLQTYADETNENLEAISEGLYAIAADMEMLNGRLSEIDPLLNDYLQLITETNDATRQVRAQMSSQLDRVHAAIKIAMIWLALSQLAPIFLGIELLAGKRR
jgi:methyl-accepting chemotaxis protein